MFNAIIALMGAMLGQMGCALSCGALMGVPPPRCGTVLCSYNASAAGACAAAIIVGGAVGASVGLPIMQRTRAHRPFMKVCRSHFSWVCSSVRSFEYVTCSRVLRLHCELIE